MNVYRYTFASECPMNGEAIIYSLEMRSEQRILVEHIKTACALHKRAFHEHIAADLSQKFGAAITLTANHHGVVIETQLAATAPSAPAAPVVTADAVLSVVGLGQGDAVIAGLGHVDQGVPMPAAGADEETPGLVNFGCDGSKQYREVAAPAGPHGADGTAELRRSFDGDKDAR